MPDIQLLPEIAVYFGCTIDDLFNLSEQAQFERIENMLDMQAALSADEFAQAERFLTDKLSDHACRSDAFRLLAELYNRKADELRKSAEMYAKEALELAPELKQNHNNLQRAQEGTTPTGILPITAGASPTTRISSGRIPIIPAAICG